MRAAPGAVPNPPNPLLTYTTTSCAKKLGRSVATVFSHAIATLIYKLMHHATNNMSNSCWLVLTSNLRYISFDLGQHGVPITNAWLSVQFDAWIPRAIVSIK